MESPRKHSEDSSFRQKIIIFLTMNCVTQGRKGPEKTGTYFSLLALLASFDVRCFAFERG